MRQRIVRCCGTLPTDRAPEDGRIIAPASIIHQEIAELRGLGTWDDLTRHPKHVIWKRTITIMQVDRQRKITTVMTSTAWNIMNYVGHTLIRLLSHINEKLYGIYYGMAMVLWFIYVRRKTAIVQPHRKQVLQVVSWLLCYQKQRWVPRGICGQVPVLRSKIGLILQVRILTWETCLWMIQWAFTTGVNGIRECCSNIFMNTNKWAPTLMHAHTRTRTHN